MIKKKKGKLKGRKEEAGSRPLGHLVDSYIYWGRIRLSSDNFGKKKRTGSLRVRKRERESEWVIFCYFKCELR